MKLGENLKKLRKIKGLSQKTVADSIKISSVSIQNYECGRRTPPLEILIDLADFFDVPLDYLVGREELQAKAEPFDGQGASQIASSLASIAIEALMETHIDVPANKIPSMTMYIYERIVRDANNAS